MNNSLLFLGEVMDVGVWVGGCVQRWDLFGRCERV